MLNNTVREAYRQASSFLAHHGINDPLFEAEWMLRELLGVDRATFFLRWDESLTSEQQAIWQQWLTRRAAHEPLQYIFGHATFYGRRFTVTPAVLIPRPETELLVEHVLTKATNLWGDDRPLRVVEVGTGSGCISITLQLERPHWSVTTIDISEEALAIAQQNAAKYNVAKNIHFVQGSYLSPVLEQAFDIVVSNPPYIPSQTVLQLDREVQEYEPHIALDGGDDGLQPYRDIISQIKTLPRQRKRLVAFEIGDEQGQVVASLLQGDKGEVEVLQDMNERDRYVILVEKD
jgi:release factor glutamine methyltransferase